MRRTRGSRNQSLGNGIDTVPVPAGPRAGGEVAETLEHDLEDHIEILRELDEQRKESAELRDQVAQRVDNNRAPNEASPAPPQRDFITRRCVDIRPRSWDIVLL